MRIDNLESAFAIRKASVTESSAVSVEYSRRNPDWLVSNRLCFDIMAGEEKFGYFSLHEGTEGE